MGWLHWLIVIPFYFFGSLAALPLLILICRLLRLKISINALVGAAIALSIAGIVIPLAADWVDLTAFRGRQMLALAVLSMLLVAVDAILVNALPLPLDQELHDL